MANMGGLDRKSSSNKLRFEEFVPSSGWTQDSDSHCLIIDLPGFKRDQVKLQVDDYGRLVASGERQVNENKHVRFEQSYKIPENSDIEDTTAKFEDEILYIIIPKKATDQEKEQNENTNANEAAVQEQKNQQNASDHKDENLHRADRNEGMSKEDEDEEEEEAKEKVGEEEEEEFHDAKTPYQQNNDLLGKLSMEMWKNKGILITAVLAFSLGVLVSRQFQASEK